LEKDQFSFRPSVYAVIEKDGKFLVVTIKSTGRLWFLGGGVNLCESLHDALRREVLEEAGLKVTKINDLILGIENLMYCKIEKVGFHVIGHFYRCEIEEAEKYESNPNDDDPNQGDLRWLTLEEIKEIGFHDKHDELMLVIEKFITPKYV
jgi:8-oxo-dGTP pyrophosphatase MutT (NUDIX family)